MEDIAAGTAAPTVDAARLADRCRRAELDLTDERSRRLADLDALDLAELRISMWQAETEKLHTELATARAERDAAGAELAEHLARRPRARLRRLLAGRR